MKRRVICLLLTLAMLLGMVPAMAMAADTEHAITVSGTTTFTTTQGAELVIKMTDLFTDGEGHEMTYTLSGENLGQHTKLADGALHFTNSDVGEYTAKITAVCASDASVTAEATLTITVGEGEKGDENQYAYDETPQDSVRVWVTISSDGIPILGNDGTVLSHLEVNVPYFDLGLYDLTDYYRYGTENGSGSYTGTEVIKRPTALHLYLYMLGVYYLGYTPEEVVAGQAEIVGAEGNRGVENLLGAQAYEDSNLALNITGSATSLYMQQFWGHDENLMYYRNHVYPLMSAGWGSTADYILLSDDDTIDLAMFSNWSFWQYGAFACFDQDEYSVQPGGTVNFCTQKYDTKSVAEGGGETTEPISGLNVAVYDANWKYVADVEPLVAEGSDYTYTFDKAGTYYLLAIDPNACTDDACYAPATAKVTVGSGEAPFDPAEYYKDFDFSSISLDAAGTDYIYNISEGTVEVNGFMNQGEKKVYTVTIPEGTQFVYVTYPADFEETIVSYCAFFNLQGEENWGVSSSDFAITENDDGTRTITLPAAVCMDEDVCIALENESYNYFNSFYFVTGENTKPGGSTGVSVTGVTLDRAELTVDRNATAELTATVLPEDATNKKISWKSADTAVATVKNGVVTGVGAGETTITVTTADGGFTAECKVTVTDANKPEVDENGVYQIATAGQLKWFAYEINYGGNKKLNAVLTEDIDLSTVCGAGIATWQPIGDKSANSSFNGTFDGQGHTIRGLYINKPLTVSELTNGSNYYTGLFGEISGGTVKNLTVYGELIIYGRFNGGIAGRVYEGTIENCHNYVYLHGDPTSNDIYGHAGIVGNAQSSNITNCSNHATINGLQGYTGGIAGQVGGKTVIEGCYNEGEIYLRGVNTSSRGYFLGVGGIVGKINTGFNNDGVVISNCYNTGKVHCYYRTQAQEQRLGGIAGNTEDKAANTVIKNCYNIGEITADETSLPVSKRGGIIGYAGNGAATLTGCLYLNGTAPNENAYEADIISADDVKSGALADMLGESYLDSCGHPVLSWQTVVEHKDEDNDGVCDACGKTLAEIKVPHLIEGVANTKQDTVQVGIAYLLSELQAGKVFIGADGERITYKNVYYQRSTDGGETWGERIGFTEAIFGATTIQVTELEPGTYTYRFTASLDGVHFSTDTWTLTLNVVKDAPLNFTVKVGQDYNYSANGNVYPIVKVYPSLGTDEDGKAIPDYDNPVELLYSNFTSELPEGAAEYDAAKGTLADNYNTFYISVPAGDYYFESWGWDSTAENYTVNLGGMQLKLPTDKNVDGGAGGGSDIVLQCVSVYTTSKKTDNTYFNADEYYVKLVCPIMGCTATMGEPYVKGNYTYYPVMLYAAGNACLYNYYLYPTIDGYIFTQAINQIFPASYRAATKSGNINIELILTVTVPSSAEFDLFFQWNNFNTTAIEPYGSWKDNGNGTKTVEYPISKGNSNYTWRMTSPDYTTQAGWIKAVSASTELTLSYADDAPTVKTAHDFSRLGTQTEKRDEADLQVNLDPSGFKVLDGTTRVRAYRHWQIIDSDAGNIMVEPDFHWDVYSGDAALETVNGGNTTANWADITAGTQDSVISVYYDNIEVNPGSYGSHGGLFPATQPQRVGFMVIGGTGVTHGTADADVDFNMASGVTTTRSMDWDYNYDTWFYGANEENPSLDFAVKATGSVTVEYALAGASADMETYVSGYTAVTAGEDGRYTVPLAGYRTIGNGKGGTVIIKMTDDTGVSYRLVRVAEVTITAENISNPKEPIMPGDQVKLTWTGMFRAVNKISGIFNPTTFKPTYYFGETKLEGTLGQYQRMDNASVTVTIPSDVTFADGAETAEVAFTNGYTYGSMYSAANPFRFIYEMTDTGVGTNFNAVTVTYFMNHYADAVVTVSRKVLYDTALSVKDENGNVLDGVTVGITGPNGEVEAGENGRFQLGYGAYSYTVSKNGYVTTRGSFSLGSADAEKVQDGILTIETKVVPAAGENAWDGTSKTEPQKDEDGVYLIGTAAELAWFAANGGEGSAKLTADIELTGYDWTPMNKFYGTFDGQGHVIKNLYINSASYPVGLFGYLQANASVTKLGITGMVTCTAASNAQAGGIAGYMNANSSITECFSSVDVASKKHAGGIAGYVSNNAVISDCYATGNISTMSTNECYLGGICASAYNTTNGATLTNCYFAGTVTGTGGNASYIGGISCNEKDTFYTNCYYLSGSLSGESASYGVKGKGTEKTAEELKALASTLGDKFAEDKTGINGGFPILAWQAGPVAPAATATVDFTAQAEGAFLMAPAKNVTVSGDLAESYGYTDSIAPEDGVSALDVLVKAHELIFGNTFTPDTKDTLLDVSASGTASVIFGVATMSNGFMVNHMYPHDGTPATSGGGYNGTFLNNTIVKDGDLAEFFILQDTNYWLDSYGWFVQNGEYTRTVTAEAGKPTELTFMSTYFMMGYTYKDLAAMIAGGSATESVQIAMVNMTTGEITDITGAVADENGKVSLTFAEPGEYVITAYMPADEITENMASPIIMSLTSVTVTEASVKLGDVNGDGEVNAADAAMVYACYNGKLELTDEQRLAADVNGDGEINAADAAMVYAFYNGKLDKFPAEK